MVIKNNKRGIKSLYHLIIGISLIIKGLDKIEHHHSVIGIIVLFIGLAIIGYYAYINIRKKSNHILNIAVHLCEGLALLLTSYIYFKDGKTYLPYVLLVAGVGFIIVGIIHLKKGKH
jgi:FtsH-binding integral membrane protein